MSGKAEPSAQEQRRVLRIHTLSGAFAKIEAAMLPLPPEGHSAPPQAVRGKRARR